MGRAEEESLPASPSSYDIRPRKFEKNCSLIVPAEESHRIGGDVIQFSAGSGKLTLVLDRGSLLRVKPNHSVRAASGASARPIRTLAPADPAPNRPETPSGRTETRSSQPERRFGGAEIAVGICRDEPRPRRVASSPNRLVFPAHRVVGRPSGIFNL